MNPANQANFPPGQGYPPPGPPRPPVKTPTDWRRTWLYALLVGTLAFVAVGVGAFSFARYTGDSGYGPISCQGGSPQCVRGVDANALVADLKRRGFTCKVDHQGTYSNGRCELAIGNNQYDATLTMRNDLVETVEFAVVHHRSLDPSARHLGFLAWLSVLPFEKDPAARAVAKKWFAERVGGGRDQTVRIRGYTYEFTRSREGRIVLNVKGGYRS